MTVAILLSNQIVENWQYKIIESVSKKTELKITILKFKVPSKKPAFLEVLYHKFENKAFKLNPNALAKIDLRKKEIDLEIMTIDDQQHHKFDLILNLDYRIDSSQLNLSANYGIWGICPSTLEKNKPRIPCMREMLQEEDVVEINLISKNNKESEATLLFESKISVDKMSIKRTQNDCLWLCSRIVIRELEKLLSYNDPSDYFKSKNVVESQSLNFFTSKKIWRASNALIVFSLIKKYIRKFFFLFKKVITINQWGMYFKFQRDYNGIENFKIADFKPLAQPRDRFWADPFILKKNEKYYVFFEELIYKNIKGHLSVMEINSDGTYTKPELILKTDYHLSYPFLIEENGKLYMIPETSEHKTIELFECVSFPYEWKLIKNLKENIVAVDTTVFKKDNLFWMFANVREQEGTSKHNELFLYYSEAIDSDEWLPHPQNPIVSDVTRSRPAGNVFENNGKLYRPSQNCGKSYGYNVEINEIEILSKIEYKEKTINTVLPNKRNNILSTHTFNKADDLILIDGRFEKLKFLK